MLSGDTIKTLRKEKLWSQEELAEHSGLSLRTIQRLEKGQSQPQPHSIKSLADALGVESKELTISNQSQESSLKPLIKFNFISLLVVVIPLVHIFILHYFWKKDPSPFCKKVISFQIIWTVLTPLITLILIPLVSYLTTGQTVVGRFPYSQTAYGALLAYNIFFTLRNTSQLAQGKVPALRLVPSLF